jgi:hypothetical protein
MITAEKEIEAELKELSNSVKDLVQFFKKELDFNQMIYTHWSMKDILGHLTFWHESFAKNLQDLTDSVKPNPLKGKLSEVNQMSVDTTRAESIHNLINRLQTAQNSIKRNIGNNSIKLIPYKKGSRDYSRIEHLQIVAHHIKKHLRDLNKKMN